MNTAAIDALLAALAAQGDAAALVRGGKVLAQSANASLLGDVVALAAQAPEADKGAPPRLVEGPDGRVYEVRASALGELVAVVGRDVTDRDELRRAVARSNEILSIGSHELKGPLHVIGMICHLVETRVGRGDPIDRATLDRLRRQVTRLTRLLNELLDASRLQEGRMTLDIEELDLVELIDEQVVTASARRPDLTLELPEHAPVRGDRARLGAVCFQLIDNAVRFTQPGIPIRVSLNEEGSAWLLRVVDEGPGIAPDQVRHLFQRNPGRPKEKQPAGLGLGLFVAAAAVRMHRGTIDYAPGPRGGSSFTVRLPRA